MAASTRGPLFVKPGAGSLIRHPRSMREMPEEGFEIRENDAFRGYWNRMIRTGDLVVVPKPAPKPKAQPKKEG